MKKRLECKIIGRVQMVMFRDFATRNARKLGIVGTVENMKDGSVFAVAEGEEEVLQKFFDKIKKGPILAKVENVLVEWKDFTGTFNKFEIVYRDIIDRF